MDDILMNETIQSTISNKNKRILNKKSQLEVTEPQDMIIVDKNYEKLVSDLNLKATDEANLQEILEKVNKEIKSVLKTSKKSSINKSNTVNSIVQSRDPRCRERIKAYLESNPMERNLSGAEKPNGFTSQTIMEQNKKLSVSNFEQRTQINNPPQSLRSASRLMRQNKEPDALSLKQSKSMSSLIQNTSVKNQDVQNLNSSNQNIQDEKNEINNNTLVNTKRRESKNIDFISSKMRANILTSGKYSFSSFRRNILSKYNQGLYKCPRNTSNSYNPRANRQHFYSNTCDGRYFRDKKPNVTNTSIKKTVASMLDSLDSASPRLSSSESGNLKNPKILIDLKQKRKDSNVQCNLDSTSILEKKKSQISEDSDSEALSMILSKIKRFQFAAANLEESGDVTQVLKPSLPYQDPLQNTQTKDILLILNEDKKKVVTLKTSDGFSQLSEKLMNCLTKDVTYECLLNKNQSLNYLTYNTKFEEWVDIDDVESFKLIDGLKLKVSFGNLHNKRKKTTTKDKSKKQRIKNVETENSILVGEENLVDQQNIIQIEGSATEELCDELVYEKMQDTTAEEHSTGESDNDSNCKTNKFNTSENYFQKLEKFLECMGMGNDQYTENSNGNNTSITSFDISSKNETNKKLCLKQAVPEELKEILINRSHFKNQHPVQQLDIIAKKMHWLLPEYNLVKEMRHLDNTTSFLFAVKINGVNVVGEKAGTNKKNAKKLAAETCLKELELSKEI